MTSRQERRLRWLLRLLAAALLLAIALPAEARDVSQWRPVVAEASARFGVPSAWIERVIQLESGGRTRLAGRPITSTKGAMGLMQLMPATWAEMRASHGLGDDPHDPRDNILAGTAYLRAMYDRFGYPGLFGAYNAGPGRYAAYLAGGTLPAETRAYLAAIEATGTAPIDPIAPRQESLFAYRSRDENVAPASAKTPAPPGATLFAIRHP